MERLTSRFQTASESKFLKVLLLLLCCTVAINAGAATVTWDGDAGDGLWNTAANWDGDILPTATDDVVIDNGDAVTLSTGAVT
ncbi:MAG: hypothetical protein KDC44_25025, partial [Phaeodactylibacter sp.]|nr:hypothetical protein [Phaeodactylibacter sp.]